LNLSIGQWIDLEKSNLSAMQTAKGFQVKESTD